MKLQIADIATNERKKLEGFKVFGVFPFYLRVIKTGTHIRLCRIKEQIQQISESDPKNSDFYDSKLQEKLIPLINKYCVTALVNNRFAGWFFRIVLNSKIKNCGHSHILNLYMTIMKLDEPAFFLTYWNWINQVDHTLLREAKQF